MANANVAIYAGGPIMDGYTGAPPNSSSLMDTLAQSGFTTVLGYTIWIEDAGGEGNFKACDLSFNHLPVDGTKSNLAIVSEGKYQGPPGWAAQLKALKTGGTVTRIYFSTLGRFSRIKIMIANGQAKPDGMLYKNFAALKDALPIDGIDLDDEDLWDQDTTTAFALMLNGLGYEVSFCPYGNGFKTGASYWAGCLAALNTKATPNVVTGFNLQCYDGGSPETLAAYVDEIHDKMKPIGWTKAEAAAFVTPGFWSLHGNDCEGSWPDDVTAQYSAWAKQSIPTLQGGFMYILDSLVNAQGGTCKGDSLDAYAASIVTGVSKAKA